MKRIAMKQNQLNPLTIPGFFRGVNDENDKIDGQGIQIGVHVIRLAEAKKSVNSPPICADASLALKLVLPKPDSILACQLWATWDAQDADGIAPSLWGRERNPCLSVFVRVLAKVSGSELQRRMPCWRKCCMLDTGLLCGRWPCGIGLAIPQQVLRPLIPQGWPSWRRDLNCEN
jgi:hypothetical protein